MYYLMPVVFVLGIIAIALEDKIKINKSATALFVCITLWLMLVFGSGDILVERQNPDFLHFLKQTELEDAPVKEQIVHYLTENTFVSHLGDVAQTLFFVMCSLLIVNIVDRHGGFLAISRSLHTDNKRKLLWMIGLSSFFFSALLDNLAAAIVLIAVLRKLVPDHTDRMKYASIIVLTANAGGSWSPIGDVTTLLLWTGGNITAWHQISHLFLPALGNLLVTLIIADIWLFRKGARLRQTCNVMADDIYIERIPNSSRIVIFWIGILSLAFVPVFQSITHLPAFMCVLIGLVFLWIYTDLMYSHLGDIRESDKLCIPTLARSVDLPTIFFFFGILMSVAALKVGGQLSLFADLLSSNIREPYAITIIVGAISSVVDNVALVAATMGMFPVAETVAATTPYMNYFVADGGFWTLLTYCAVTGGSILIIGSATGVAVMGLEKISFGYYLKRFTPLAIVGYVVGILLFMLMG
jgi:Na+/H+ antiporter NhaD/arsenite permease-like protein